MDTFDTAAFPCVAQYTSSIQVWYWSYIVCLSHNSSTQFSLLKDTDDENEETVIDRKQRRAYCYLHDASVGEVVAFKLRQELKRRFAHVDPHS